MKHLEDPNTDETMKVAQEFPCPNRITADEPVSTVYEYNAQTEECSESKFPMVPPIALFKTKKLKQHGRTRSNLYQYITTEKPVYHSSCSESLSPRSPQCETDANQCILSFKNETRKTCFTPTLKDYLEIPHRHSSQKDLKHLSHKQLDYSQDLPCSLGESGSSVHGITSESTTNLPTTTTDCSSACEIVPLKERSEKFTRNVQAESGKSITHQNALQRDAQSEYCLRHTQPFCDKNLYSFNGRSSCCPTPYSDMLHATNIPLCDGISSDPNEHTVDVFCCRPHSYSDMLEETHQRTQSLQCRLSIISFPYSMQLADSNDMQPNILFTKTLKKLPVLLRNIPLLSGCLVVIEFFREFEGAENAIQNEGRICIPTRLLTFIVKKNLVPLCQTNDNFYKIFRVINECTAVLEISLKHSLLYHLPTSEGKAEKTLLRLKQCKSKRPLKNELIALLRFTKPTTSAYKITLPPQKYLYEDHQTWTNASEIRQDTIELVTHKPNEERNPEASSVLPNEYQCSDQYASCLFSFSSNQQRANQNHIIPTLSSPISNDFYHNHASSRSLNPEFCFSRSCKCCQRYSSDLVRCYPARSKKFYHKKHRQYSTFPSNTFLEYNGIHHPFVYKKNQILSPNSHTTYPTCAEIKRLGLSHLKKEKNHRIHQPFSSDKTIDCDKSKNPGIYRQDRERSYDSTGCRYDQKNHDIDPCYTQSKRCRIGISHNTHQYSRVNIRRPIPGSALNFHQSKHPYYICSCCTQRNSNNSFVDLYKPYHKPHHVKNAPSIQSVFSLSNFFHNCLSEEQICYRQLKCILALMFWIFLLFGPLKHFCFFLCWIFRVLEKF